MLREYKLLFFSPEGGVFLFESFNGEGRGWYWQEDGGSLLTTRFMTIAEQRHKVQKLSKRVFSVFVSAGHRNLDYCTLK